MAFIRTAVSRSAAQGDEVATGILREAVERRRVAAGVPVSIAGGVWKVHPLVFRVFTANVKRTHPQVNVVPPLFNPVAGGILLGLKEKGYSIESNLFHLKQCLEDLIYRMPE